MQIFLLLITLWMGLEASAQAVPPQPEPPAGRNVVLVIIDGVRQQEWGGRAVDDAGKPVKLSELFPVLLKLRQRGLWLPNVAISNPAGVSLPAYADIFAGRRQEKILSNYPPAEDFRTHYPTLMQEAQKQLRLGFDGVSLIASWAPLCQIAALAPLKPEEEFYRSCSFKSNAPQTAEQPLFFKPEVYGGSRTDIDTFVDVLREVPKRHPRLLVIHLGDADEEAHLHARVQRKLGQHYGIFHYHQALRQDDYLLGRIWDALQSDPFYRDNTYLIVTTDHGRDTAEDPAQWASHGRCIAEKIRTKPCSGCSGVFALAVGPGLTGKTARGTYLHTDIAPTIAKLLGIQFPSATGKPIREIVEPAARAPQRTGQGAPPVYLTLPPQPMTATVGSQPAPAVSSAQPGTQPGAQPPQAPPSALGAVSGPTASRPVAPAVPAAAP